MMMDSDPPPPEPTEDEAQPSKAGSNPREPQAGRGEAASATMRAAAKAPSYRPPPPDARTSAPPPPPSQPSVSGDAAREAREQRFRRRLDGVIPEVVRRVVEIGV